MKARVAMNTPQQFDPSTLVLRMVGGTLDGKLLPIKTQKCFLAGGSDEGAGQCAIIRGASGTALRAVNTEVSVNGKPDSVHWLSQGDTITIGQTKMVVVQLGKVPQTEVSQDQSDQSAKNSTATKTAPASKPKEQSPARETKVAAAANVPAAKVPAVEAKTNSALPTPAEPSETEESNKTNPVDAKSPTEEKPQTNQERLERALNSLPGLSDSPAQESTENQVNQRLNQLESELDSHNKSYSETVPVAPSDSDAETINEPEATTKAETTAEADVNEVEQTSDTIESTAEEALSALPPLPPVEQQTDSQHVDDVDVSNDEQAKLDEIMARLGVPVDKKEDTPSEETEAEQPEPEQAMDTTEPTEKPVREAAPTMVTIPSEELFPSKQIESDTATESTAQTEEQADELPAEPVADAVVESEVSEPVSKEPVSEEPVAEEPVAEEPVVEEPVVEEPSNEELSEPPAEPAAQQSVAEILARMQSEGKLDQFEEPTDENGFAAEAGPAAEPVASTPIPEPAQPEPTAQPSPEGPGSEASVQDYMNQLFQRLRGDEAADSTPVPAPAPATAPAETALPLKAEAETVPETATQPEAEPQAQTPQPTANKVLEANEYVPQQKAPEAKADLQALRQLANKQKSNNVSRSVQEKSRLDQAISTYVAGGAFAGALLFGWIAKSLFDPAGILAMVCFIVSMGALYRYVSNLKKMKQAK